MRTYLVTFRDKKTQATKHEVKVSLELEDETKTGLIVLAALKELRDKGVKLPNVNKYSWSFRVLEN